MTTVLGGSTNAWPRCGAPCGRIIERYQVIHYTQHYSTLFLKYIRSRERLIAASKGSYYVPIGKCPETLSSGSSVRRRGGPVCS